MSKLCMIQYTYNKRYLLQNVKVSRLKRIKLLTLWSSTHDQTLIYIMVDIYPANFPVAVYSER